LAAVVVIREAVNSTESHIVCGTLPIASNECRSRFCAWSLLWIFFPCVKPIDINFQDIFLSQTTGVLASVAEVSSTYPVAAMPSCSGLWLAVETFGLSRSNPTIGSNTHAAKLIYLGIPCEMRRPIVVCDENCHTRRRHSVDVGQVLGTNICQLHCRSHKLRTHRPPNPLSYSSMPLTCDENTCKISGRKSLEHFSVNLSLFHSQLCPRRLWRPNSLSPSLAWGSISHITYAEEHVVLPDRLENSDSVHIMDAKLLLMLNQEPRHSGTVRTA
jgi:hypothetical protein